MNAQPSDEQLMNVYLAAFGSGYTNALSALGVPAAQADNNADFVMELIRRDPAQREIVIRHSREILAGRLSGPTETASTDTATTDELARERNAKVIRTQSTVTWERAR